MRISDWSSDVCSSDLRRWLELSPHERAQCFPSKPLWQRALIVAAGPAIHFLFAIVVLAGFAMVSGQNVPPPVVNKLFPGAAAEQDRKSVVQGKSVSVRVDLGGRRII